MAKKRILVVTERFYPEEFLINDLVLEMKNNNLDVEVLTQIPSYPFDKVFSGFKNKLKSTDSYQGIKIHRVYTKLGYNKSSLKKILGYIVFAFLTWIRAFSLAKSFDIIFYYHTGPATMAHSVKVFKKFFKKRCIIWTQDIWPDAIFAYGIRETKFRKKILERYLRNIYKHFDEVLTSCKGFNSIIKGYYNGEVTHVAQWYSENNVNKAANVIKEKLQFTFLGNIGSVQNLENVCLGFLNAIEKGLNAQLNIVGEGVYFSSLKEIVNKSASNDIILWGRKPSNQMHTFTADSNVMIISLKDDPLLNMYVPAKFQGYLAGNRPIMGILKGEVAKIISKNELGFTAEPNDINDIANVFMKFSEKTDQFEEMGSRSYSFYKKNYDRIKNTSMIMSKLFHTE